MDWRDNGGEQRLAVGMYGEGRGPADSNRVIAYTLLCGYSPFRADDKAELVKETTRGKIHFHERYWKKVSETGECEYQASGRAGEDGHLATLAKWRSPAARPCCQLPLTIQPRTSSGACYRSTLVDGCPRPTPCGIRCVPHLPPFPSRRAYSTVDDERASYGTRPVDQHQGEFQPARKVCRCCTCASTSSSSERGAER